MCASVDIPGVVPVYLSCLSPWTGLRVEWAKSLARAERWEEELILVQEEMRRVLLSLKNKAHWWLEQSTLREHGSIAVLSGITAYAHKQADLRLALASDFALEWLAVHDDYGLPRPTDWAEQFLNATPTSKQRHRRPDRRKLRRRAPIVLSQVPNPIPSEMSV